MLIRVIVALVCACALGFIACGGGRNTNAGESTPAGGNSNTQPATLQGVLMWKGDPSTNGLYGNENTLTPQNVGGGAFGKKTELPVDGIVMGQPLFVSQLNMGPSGTHNVMIVATEHDSVYAFDADSQSPTPLWQRHYVDATATTYPDNFGGTSVVGGEVGITGTPVIDGTTGAMYFVTMLQRNGTTAEQWLRAVDIRTGQDYGAGSMIIQASVAGDGAGSQNGQIRFDPSVQNQRAGLILANGAVVVAWGSFSDWGVYHGWLMAYDPKTLAQKAVFNSTTQFQSSDTADGPATHGGGGAFWQAGAAPSIDAAGNLYVVAANGSFNADQGGRNHGDTVLKLQLAGNTFRVVDWFTPSNQACVNPNDLEIGSGGVSLLPASASPGRQLALVVNKEGRVYLLDVNNLGRYNPAGDAQIPQQFLAGNQACFEPMPLGYAEGTGWQRLYGNPSYWNGNLYLGLANGTLKQYRLQNGLVNTTPLAQGATVFGIRGGNTVVSANGTQNAILWVYDKSTNGGGAVLHAYDAKDVSHELWNSNRHTGDGMGVGIGFGTPIVANGKVITTYNKAVVVYGLH